MPIYCQRNTTFYGINVVWYKYYIYLNFNYNNLNRKWKMYNIILNITKKYNRQGTY